MTYSILVKKYVYDFLIGNIGGHINLGKGKKVKLSLCLTKHYAMKAYGRVDV
jgi:hypothetical protein